MQVVNDSHLSTNIRDMAAPDDLAIPFWPVRKPLQELERYDSTVFWLAGMKEATQKAYKTHLRLLCRFYQTDPDTLVKCTDEQLKLLLDAYLLHLLKVSVRVAGKPKPGQVSVNSIPLYFTGLKSFFVEAHEFEINWSRYEKKFPERVSNNLRGYQRDEVQKLYKAADHYDKLLVLLEYCTSVRVGAIGAMRLAHITPIPEMPDLAFLKVYADSADESYYVVLSAEFMKDLQELKAHRERWGEKLTDKSFLICRKHDAKNRLPQTKPLKEEAIRMRMRRLARLAGVDLTNIQPNHGMRKSGNTAMKNAHVDKDFKEMLMGHSTGLDDVYYDIENPESRKEIVIEYMKAVDALTVNDENKLKRKVDDLQEKLKDAPKLEVLQNSILLHLLW